MENCADPEAVIHRGEGEVDNSLLDLHNSSYHVWYDERCSSPQQ